jgi:hypothetical protein
MMTWMMKTAIMKPTRTRTTAVSLLRMIVTIVLEMATRCILLLVTNLTLLRAIRNAATADGAPIDQKQLPPFNIYI